MNTLLIATHCSLENKLLGNYLSFLLLMSLLCKTRNFSASSLRAWPFPAQGQPLVACPSSTVLAEVTLVGHLCHPWHRLWHHLQVMLFLLQAKGGAEEIARELLS